MTVFNLIKFDGISNRNWLVYHFPGNDFNNGSKLIVGEGQIAVFVKGGQAMDCLSAGTHTLKTDNIPILQSFINLPYRGKIPHQNIPFVKTPFTADVYFINKTAKLDILWGTNDPIALIDPKYNVRLRVRAFGQFGIKISDYRIFLTELIGAIGMDEIVKYRLVTEYFRGLIVNKVKTIIADIIINQKLSVLDITPKLEEVSSVCSKRIADEFNKYGIEIINFFINSINYPDEDFETINKILGEKAAFEIIGDNRYNVKRTFDVMETSAGNEGAGNIASAGIGLGIGAGAGMTIGEAFANSISNTTSPGLKPNKTICSNCGTPNVESKFCSNCGNSLIIKQFECHSCRTLVDEGTKYCPNCGISLTPNICSSCQQVNAAGAKFCRNCGSKLEVKS